MGGGGRERKGERGSASHTCTCATKHTHTYLDGWKVGGEQGEEEEGGSSYSQVSPTVRVVRRWGWGGGGGCAFVGKITASTNIARKFLFPGIH